MYTDFGELGGGESEIFFILVRASRARFGKKGNLGFLGLMVLFFCCSSGTQKREGEREREY